MFVAMVLIEHILSLIVFKVRTVSISNGCDGKKYYRTQKPCSLLKIAINADPELPKKLLIMATITFRSPHLHDKNTMTLAPSLSCGLLPKVCRARE